MIFFFVSLPYLTTVSHFTGNWYNVCVSVNRYIYLTVPGVTMDVRLLLCYMGADHKCLIKLVCTFLVMCLKNMPVASEYRNIINCIFRKLFCYTREKLLIQQYNFYSCCYSLKIICLQSNHTENSNSCSLTKVKLHRAWSVLKWGIVWEHQIL